MEHQDTYEVDGASAPINIHIVEMATAEDVEAWSERITQTLDLLPPAHLRRFLHRSEENNIIRLGGPRPVGGGAFQYVGMRYRNGSVGGRNFVRVGEKAMRGNPRGWDWPDRRHGRPRVRYNLGRYLYTFLHEFGHFIDHSPKLLANSEDAGTQFDEIAESEPLGALAILRRYHSGATGSPSEHWADIYADYFYVDIGGEDYNVNRGEPGFRCSERPCQFAERRLLRRLGDQADELPARDPTAMTRLRYRTLLRCSAFASLEEDPGGDQPLRSSEAGQ